MRMLGNKRFVRTDIWREGLWLDMWSVVHLLSGFSIGFFAYFLKFDPLLLATITLILLIVYEWWEAFVGIDEAPTNRFMDVVVVMVGYMPAYFYISPALSQSAHIVTFACVFAVNIIMSAIGWHASHKAAELERRMHERIARQKTRIAEQRRRIKQRFGKRALSPTEQPPTSASEHETHPVEKAID
jgi:hypothetical protein